MSSPATDRPQKSLRGGLEEFERSGEDRPPWMLTWTEVKLLGIAGVGFFLDAYDLFIINPVTTMLQYRLYGGHSLPVGLEGFVKAGANIGSVIGQFTFGYLADALGRKAIYGKELMLIIFATIMCISDPTNHLSPNGALIWLGIFRIVLGIGVGGDYPMSASVATDRANLRKRGTLLTYIFANQGWGSFVGSLVVMVVLAAYKGTMNHTGTNQGVDGAWRIAVGLSLIPAFGTLYQRLTLPEAKRFTDAQKLSDQEALAEIAEKEQARKQVTEKKNGESSDEHSDSSIHETPANPTNENLGDATQGEGLKGTVYNKKAHYAEFVTYFSEWRHAKILIGTCMCWFLLDIAFYGINLNQNVVLQQIGFGGKGGTTWHNLFEIATGNLIITALGFVPGYYVTLFTIEWLGRKWIQIQGFLLAALFLGILAGTFGKLHTAPFVVCFALLQFFFNFGANTTTYCYPAEVFPTRLRASAHGISAASGKAGAIISALAFNALSKKIGTANVLWIFFGCCIAGAFFTLLLPEVKDRDPDIVDLEERQAARAARKLH